MPYIELSKANIATEHICCAFSDKKCASSYALKKQWLINQFDHSYVFRRLDERAKVFIEYGPAESAWMPVLAPNYLAIGCFWVSGKYKGQGHGKALLQSVIDDAKQQGKDGLLAVVGTTKFHFLSDTKWLLAQGFELCESTPSGFSLLSLDLRPKGKRPRFTALARSGECPEKKGCVVYYSHRCPYSEYHVKQSLMATCAKRKLPLMVIELATREQAQAAPTPATIFSLYLDGAFVTTDLSVCLDSRFDKIVRKG